LIRIEDYPLSRVPENKRVSFLSVAVVHMGMLTALDQFMLGAVLGDSMSLASAFLAILAGSVIFGIVTFGLGYAGMKEGISGSLDPNQNIALHLCGELSAIALLKTTASK